MSGDGHLFLSGVLTVTDIDCIITTVGGQGRFLTLVPIEKIQHVGFIATGIAPNAPTDLTGAEINWWDYFDFMAEDKTIPVEFRGANFIMWHLEPGCSGTFNASY